MSFQLSAISIQLSARKVQMLKANLCITV